MATYNLAASDLITLLNSTVTTQTGRAILESVSSAFSSAFPFGSTSVQTTNGPADTVPSGYTVQNSDTVAAGTQLELIVLPTSTAVTGAPYTTVSAGTEMSKTGFSITTFGGVVIGAGDQYVGVTDFNTGSTADTLIGGAYLERLVSGGGKNVLIGGTGANSLVGGSGADTLIGGGQSHLQAGSGANILMSSTLTSGHDSLDGSTGADKLVAQAGNNRLVAGTGANTLVGGTGRDTLVAGGTTTTFQVGSGATKIVDSISGSRDTIFAGSGTDTITLGVTSIPSANASITGLHASIVGSSGGLRIADMTGSNTIVGGQGTDTLVLSSITAANATITNTSNQTITAGAGGVRVITNEAYSNYSLQTAAGGVNTVTFSDTGQTLTINDTTGNSVTLVFGSVTQTHSPVKI